MRKLLPLLILIPLFATGPSSVTVWKASDLKAKEKELVGKMGDKKMASEVLENYGNHNTMLAHREGDGEVEVHEKMADVFFIVSGDASLIVGGTVVGGHPTTPGEIRGASITGGEKKILGAGDTVHIPAKIPHQMMVANGKKVTYFVVKVEEK
jgi:mannose-6-phosphate isomerase-like protein (cupin superfamily)